MDDIASHPSAPPPLLGGDDPAPVSVHNGNGKARAVIVCDHGSNAVPRALHGLGLTERELHLHIAWDIGAASVTRLLADALDAPAVLANYSRLVIDCNRRPGHPESIARVSDHVAIPGNEAADEAEAARRADAIFWPYHRKIGAGLAGFAMRGEIPAIISIHSFTAVLGGETRPWQIGVLWEDDDRMAVPLVAALRRDGSLTVGENQPYSGKARYGYSIEVHATECGLPNVLVELREDMVASAEGQARTAALLADALRPVLADPALYARWGGGRQ
jgi:predicted N-formylglutamate amidohydrolase